MRHPHHQLERPARLLPGAPVCMMAHALGCDLRMWDDLSRRLLALGLPVLRYDQPGHGGSVELIAADTLAAMADQAAALIEALQTGPVIWIGLSVGGMVGQELALRHPRQVRALVLANTTSGYPPAAQQGWMQRISDIRAGGLEAVVDTALSRWFHDDFRRANPALVGLWRERVLHCDARAYIACCEAIRRVDTTGRLGAIRQPCLVIAGTLDAATPPSMARALVAALPAAQLVTLDAASHLSVLEQPQAFFAAIQGWLAAVLREVGPIARPEPPWEAA